MDQQPSPGQLANKIEMHLKADITPGYVLSVAEQQLIINALRSYKPTGQAKPTNPR